MGYLKKVLSILANNCSKFTTIGYDSVILGPCYIPQGGVVYQIITAYDKPH